MLRINGQEGQGGAAVHYWLTKVILFAKVATNR